MFGRLKDLIRATLLLTVLVAQSVSAQTQPLRIFHVMSFDSP